MAKIVKKREFAGKSSLVQLAGVAGFFILPLVPAVFVFIALLIIGSLMSYHWECSQCGNTVRDRRVKICPACGSAFGEVPAPPLTGTFTCDECGGEFGLAHKKGAGGKSLCPSCYEKLF